MATRNDLRQRAERVAARLERLKRGVAKAEDGAQRRQARKRLKRAQRKRRSYETLAAGGARAQKAKTA